MTTNKLKTIAGLLSCCLAAVGCRAQIKVSSTKAAQTAEPAVVPEPTINVGTPIEIPDGLDLARQYFQSRSVIVLGIQSEIVAPGDDLSLVDDTTGASLVTHQQLAMGLDEDAPARFLTDAPFDITIKLYPSLPGYAGQFNYGSNTLRLVVNDQASPRFSQSTIYLDDFRYFAVSTAHFPQNQQQAGGLQGSIDPWLSQIVTNGVGTLTTGVIATLNH